MCTDHSHPVVRLLYGRYYLRTTQLHLPCATDCTSKCRSIHAASSSPLDHPPRPTLYVVLKPRLLTRGRRAPSTRVSIVRVSERLLSADVEGGLPFPFRLEIFNQIIYHQFSQNPNLLYAILRSHKRFEELGTFTLAKGLREVQRIKQAKEDAERIKAGKPLDKGKASLDSPASADSPASPFTHIENNSSDKLLLNRESSDSAMSPTQDEDHERPIPVPPTPSLSNRMDSQFANMRVSTPPTGAPGLSDKARGKMKASGSASGEDLELSAELAQIASGGVGRNGFVPTQDWVTSWQQGYVGNDSSSLLRLTIRQATFGHGAPFDIRAPSQSPSATGFFEDLKLNGPYH